MRRTIVFLLINLVALLIIASGLYYRKYLSEQGLVERAHAGVTPEANGVKGRGVWLAARLSGKPKKKLDFIAKCYRQSTSSQRRSLLAHAIVGVVEGSPIETRKQAAHLLRSFLDIAQSMPIARAHTLEALKLLNIRESVTVDLARQIAQSPEEDWLVRIGAVLLIHQVAPEPRRTELLKNLSEDTRDESIQRVIASLIDKQPDPNPNRTDWEPPPAPPPFFRLTALNSMLIVGLLGFGMMLAIPRIKRYPSGEKQAGK